MANTAKTWFAASTIILVAATSTAIAQPSYYKHDLVNCRFDNGIEMPQVECDANRKYFATEAAKKATQDSYTAQANAKYEAAQVVEREEQARKQARWAAERAQQRAEQEARESAYARQLETENRAQASSDRKAATATLDRKAKCGNDYKAPRIGMAIDRVKECVTAVKLTSQLNRADGIVNTYEGGNAYFHVMDGRVVSWGKY